MPNRVFRDFGMLSIILVHILKQKLAAVVTSVIE
jgi:hypothetical protein